MTLTKTVSYMMSVKRKAVITHFIGQKPYSKVLERNWRSEISCPSLIFKDSYALFQAYNFRYAKTSTIFHPFSNEKLDYIIRNTDRGADNYMIKYCEGEHEKSLVDVAPTRSHSLQMPMMDGMSPTPQMSTVPSSSTTQTPFNSPPRLTTKTNSILPNIPYTRNPHIHIAAIDNSLAFPHEHPKGWRSYTYGWLYLPVGIIGQPFSQKTRDHFLPLLTSKAWWEETTFQLRKLFAVDPDYNRKMFQVSVLIRYAMEELLKCAAETTCRYQGAGVECGTKPQAP